ncbi:hypothetical protein EXIGLDRAFT_843382 [Exidia glandulosa HHB12029]|uniref:Uncharacterized protein n=1 Tax=Exidia glandulosa HHB12029 TaxID=1314781 RepID=A0A165ZHR8_EXIGL|nr:hypothetical protein EXIGLDRAFT_843382 [Exidia glandulosa HHB12029]
MQQLQREPTPEPLDIVNDDHYLLSPVLTVANSAKDNSSVSYADLREAYNLLATRVRVKVHPDKVLASFPVFKPLHAHHAQLALAIARDLRRCFVDPLKSPPSTSTHTCDTPDVFGTPDIPMSSSPVREVKRRGMSDLEIRYARDLYSVCHGALRLLSNLFAIPQLCNIFDEEELTDLLNGLLAIPLCAEIPTPNSRKTYALAIFALQTQRLPIEIVEAAKPRITYAFSRAIEGQLGKEGKKGSATDALKAVAEHLHSEPAEFLDSFVDLLPSILQSILSPNASIRTQCVHAFGAFVMAKTCINVDEPGNAKYRDTFAIISQQVGKYIEGMFAERKDTKPLDKLSTALKITLSSEEIDNKVTGPIWGACTFATLVVLSGGQLFRRQSSLKMTLEWMPYLTKHKLPHMKAIGRLVWRCLVWCFVELQRAADALEDGTEKRNQLASCDAAWKIVRQVVDGTVGLATVVAVLCDRSTRGVRRALEVVQNMLAGSSKSHQFATEILQQLTAGATDRKAKRECGLNPENALLYAGLFDGNLMNFDQAALAATLQKVVKLVNVSAVRALTDAEVHTAWNNLCNLWKKALFQTELCASNEVPAALLDIWRNLLVAKTLNGMDGERVDPDNATQHRVVAVFRECLSKTDQPEIKPEQRMHICCQLWRVVREAFSAEVCGVLARALLEELIDFDLAAGEVVEEEEQDQDVVLRPWAEFVAGLLVVSTQDLLYGWMSSAEMDVDAKRALWVALGREWNSDETSSYDGAVYLVSCPFRAWTLSTDEWGVWDGIVATAVERGAGLFVAANAVLDRICGLIGGEDDDLLNLSEIVRHLLEAVVVTGNEEEPVPTGIFTAIGLIVEQLYPPRRVDMDDIIDLLYDVSSFAQTMPANMVLPFLDATQEGLIVWNIDSEKALSDRLYARHVTPLYTNCLGAMTKVKLTPAHLDAYSPFLASTMQRIPIGPDSPAALHEFWEHVRGEIPQLRACCPESLLPFLELLDESGDVAADIPVDDESVGPEVDMAMVDDSDTHVLDAVPASADEEMEDDSWDAVEECTTASHESASQLVADVSEIEIEDDELDWVHRTPSPGPSVGEIDDDISEERTAGLARPTVLPSRATTAQAAVASTSTVVRRLPPSPRTPRTSRRRPAQSSSSNADVAFFLDSGKSNSIVPSSMPTFDNAHPRHTIQPDESPLLPRVARTVLGKRQRIEESVPTAAVAALVRRQVPDDDSSEEDDSIVEESLVLEHSPLAARRPITPLPRPESLDVDSPISSCSDSSESQRGSSRKRRVLDAVELPRLRPEEKEQHVLMSSLAKVLLPMPSVTRPPSRGSQPDSRKHPRAPCAVLND